MARKRTDESPEYQMYCNCCGKDFIALRSDARFCSDLCRIAVKNKSTRLKEHVPAVTKEDLEKYKQLIKGLEVSLIDKKLKMASGSSKEKEPTISEQKTDESIKKTEGAPAEGSEQKLATENDEIKPDEASAVEGEAYKDPKVGIKRKYKKKNGKKKPGNKD